jgi:hypothetical protein
MIVTWLDARRGLSDLYAQHVRADGTADPAWTQDGNAVTQSGTAGSPTIFGDGRGGALIVWFDEATGAVYAQRMHGDGTRVAGPANGRLLVSTSSEDPLIYQVSIEGWSADPAGNLYVLATYYNRLGIASMWLNRFDLNGDPAWAGAALAGGTSNNLESLEGVGLAVTARGATVVFGDHYQYSDPYEHVEAWNTFATQTLSSGAREYFTPLSTLNTPTRTIPAGLAVDVAGSAFIREDVGGVIRLMKLDSLGVSLWPTDRSIATGGRLIADDVGGVYAVGGPGVAIDRRAEDGTVPAGWSGSGLQITPSTPSGSVASAIVPGGILLCWTDDARGGASHVHAIGITNAGAIAAGWKAGGLRISSGRGVQASPSLVATSDGRGLAAWVVVGPHDGGDIYGSLVAPSPEVSRAGGPAEPASATVVGTDRPTAFSVGIEAGGSAQSRVRFALRADGDASLDLVDVAGRRVRHQIVSGARGASQTITWSTVDLPRGVYWVCLRQGGEQVSARLLLMR